MNLNDGQNRINPWIDQPFKDRVSFETAELLFLKSQVSQKDIDKLMELWAASHIQVGSTGGAPFKNHRELHRAIDDIPYGDAPWYSEEIVYSGSIPEENPPKWMTMTYEVVMRNFNLVVKNMLKNSAFRDDFDYVPYKETNSTGTRRFTDFMSGDFCWKECVRQILDYRLTSSKKFLLTHL